VNFEIRREGDSAIVAMHGDVVASVVPELRPQLGELVRSGQRNIVVDLAETTMVDSIGLGLLLAAFNSLRKVDGRLSVVNVSNEILDLFRTLRIHQHFAVSGK
jgi:anti-anti-sigma factor